MCYGSYSNGKSFIVALVLCLLGFAGLAGLHRLYTGKVFTGILFLLTGGLAGIGTVWDTCMILTGNYRTDEGYPLFL